MAKRVSTKVETFYVLKQMCDCGGEFIGLKPEPHIKQRDKDGKEFTGVAVMHICNSCKFAEYFPVSYPRMEYADFDGNVLGVIKHEKR